MKKALFTVLFAAIALAASAQDIIVKKDGTQIKAKITIVAPDEIFFNKWEFPDGPSFSISKNDINYIQYENGNKEVINDIEGQAKLVKENPRMGKTTFQAYVNLGMLVNENVIGPYVDANIGARVYDYFYAGLEVGYEYLYSLQYNVETTKFWQVPIGVNLRGYYPINYKFCPYTAFTIGCSLYEKLSLEKRIVAGLHCQWLVGCDFGRFSAGLGWDRSPRWDGYAVDAFILKVGFRFGK